MWAVQLVYNYPSQMVILHDIVQYTFIAHIPDCSILTSRYGTKIPRYLYGYKTSTTAYHYIVLYGLLQTTLAH